MPQSTYINTTPHDFVLSGSAAVQTFEQQVASSNILGLAFDPVNKTTYVGKDSVASPINGYYEYTYAFSRDGGAIGNITLKGPTLPAGFRIIFAQFCPRVAITSAGAAQISIGTSTSATTNILGAAVLGTNGTAGPKAGVPVLATPASSVRITTASVPVLAVTVDALNAGSAKLLIWGYVDNEDSAS